MPYRILIAEDDESLRRVMEYNLAAEGYAVATAADGGAARHELLSSPPDLLITDLRMPVASGIELLREAATACPDTEVILVMAHGTVDDAVLAMREGAFDFITKPVRWEELRLTVIRALERRRLRADTMRLRRELAGRFGPEKLIGGSPQIERVRQAIQRVADTAAPVLIRGESGTGKELVARALHYHGRRAAGPFVAVNCGALPRDLVESELLGVKRGAFTGADRDRTGRFEQAHQGSLLLDEVAELEPELQVKLLRVVEDGEVTPVGGEGSRPVDVRILASTHRDLEGSIRAGAFRQDLYYRLAVVTIDIPPLRERREDITTLALHFLEKLGAPQVQLNRAAIERLEAHTWPGNARELENAIMRALLFRKNPDEIDAADLNLDRGSACLPGASVPSAPEPPALPPGGLDIFALERRLIDEALARAAGNQTRAAALLGMTRQTLIYRMQKYGIKR